MEALYVGELEVSDICFRSLCHCDIFPTIFHEKSTAVEVANSPFLMESWTWSILHHGIRSDCS
jgi:hypothetical protein